MQFSDRLTTPRRFLLSRFAVSKAARNSTRRLGRHNPMKFDSPPHVQAFATGRWAEIIFLALVARVAKRWRFVSFRGQHKGEWRGVVDVIAVRKDTTQPPNVELKPGDLFDIVLIQIKGGGARRPTQQDCVRLREVAKYYHARSVVQFHWRKGVSALFFELNSGTLTWSPTTGSAIFA